MFGSTGSISMVNAKSTEALRTSEATTLMANKSALAVPIAIVLIGIGWLLNTMNVIADINWVWTLSLAGIGLLVFVMDGLNRFSIVIGPFFIAASLLSVARQANQLNSNVEAPILVILFGVLLMVSQLSRLPAPKWMLEVPGGKR